MVAFVPGSSRLPKGLFSQSISRLSPSLLVFRFFLLILIDRCRRLVFLESFFVACVDVRDSKGESRIEKATEGRTE